MGPYEYERNVRGVIGGLRISAPTTWFYNVAVRYPNSKSALFLEDLNKYVERIEMARGKNGTGKGPAFANGWTQFIDISLAGVEWGEIEAVFGSPDVVADGLARLVEDGYRVSFTHNKQSDAVMCSVTCKLEDHPNSKKSFNSFAATWFEALQVALFKHYTLTGETWGAEDNPRSGPSFG